MIFNKFECISLKCGSGFSSVLKLLLFTILWHFHVCLHTYLHFWLIVSLSVFAIQSCGSWLLLQGWNDLVISQNQNIPETPEFCSKLIFLFSWWTKLDEKIAFASFFDLKFHGKIFSIFCSIVKLNCVLFRHTHWLSFAIWGLKCGPFFNHPILVFLIYVSQITDHDSCW